MHGNDTSNTMFMLRKQAPSDNKLKDRREEGMGYTQPNGHPVNWGPKAGGCEGKLTQEEEAKGRRSLLI